MMTLSDELLVQEPMYLATPSQKTFLQWFDAALGLLSVSTLLLVGHLVKTQSNISWQGLIVTSLAMVSLFIYVLHTFLASNSISERMLLRYQEVIQGGIGTAAADEIIGSITGLDDFPPIEIVALLILKVTIILIDTRFDTYTQSVL